MIRINLLPVADEFEHVPYQIYGVLALVLVGAAVLGSWYWRLGSEQAEAMNQVASLQQQNQQLQAIQAQIQQYSRRKKSMEDRIQAIEQLQSNQKGPVQLMNDIIAAMPQDPGLWLTSLSQRGESLDLEGRAFDVPFIADFIAALNSSPRFKFVELQFWEQDPDNTIRFRLHCETQEEKQQEKRG